MATKRKPVDPADPWRTADVPDREVTITLPLSEVMIVTAVMTLSVSKAADGDPRATVLSAIIAKLSAAAEEAWPEGVS